MNVVSTSLECLDGVVSPLVDAGGISPGIPPEKLDSVQLV